MYSKSSSTGVRRAHSFDSYDNLDKLEAVQEYRKQFLNTRAKFENQPPVTPPQPPPRKNFGVKRQTSLQTASITDDLFSRQLQTLQDDLDLMVKETEQLLTGNHKNTGLYRTNAPGEKSKKFTDSEPQSLSSPVLVRRQIANNSQSQPVNEPICLKKTVVTNTFPTYFESIHLPSQNKSKSYGFERNSLKQEKANQFPNQDVSKSYSFERSTHKFQEPSELLNQDSYDSFSYVRNSLKQEEPFQQTNQNTSKSNDNGRNSLKQEEPFQQTNQNTSKSNDNGKNSFKPEEQSASESENDKIEDSTRPIPAQRKKISPRDNLTLNMKESLQSYPEYKEQVAKKTWRPVVSPGVHRSRNFQSSTPYSSPVRPENDSEKSRRLYLQSTLDNITSQQELLKSGASVNDTHSNGMPENSLERPRRISTGSMHEPVVWRSRVPPLPVKTLAQKFTIERSVP